ncbi:hypothetical protein FH972_005975 [Carpinus fangiana]|uniref:Autophagy-related protein 18a n=1 Tax=Carpinus fangiana TaxID=176857 RepID=A0A5N6QTT5_9ROSI|nr:hypothetical protein FH972_005975 [Carpinus fangiana]
MPLQPIEPHGSGQNPKPNIPTPIDPPALLHLSFFGESGCFAAGMDRGFRIFCCDPFREIVRREVDVGGISAVDMHFRYTIMALVGGGPHPNYPPNKVMLWDDNQRRYIGELSFRTEVRSVLFHRDRVVIVLEHKVYTYNLADLKLLHQIETISNLKGLCAVSQLAGSVVMVCPGLHKGEVRVDHFGAKRSKFIMAHDSKIACFALNPDGRFVATASSRGTLIRVFNTVDGTLFREVRRGADIADIYSLAFSSTAQWLAVSSDKGTVHVFDLNVNTKSPRNGNSLCASDSNLAVTQSRSFRSLVKGVLPKYFSSEWSFAQFRLLEGSHYIVAFGHQKDTVVILGMDGSFYRCQFDPTNGGEMTQLEYHNFLKPEEAF